MSQENRKELLVHQVMFETQEPSIELIVNMFDEKDIPFQPVACSWELFPYRPDVKFRIAYDNDALYLQYQVHEKYLIAKCDMEDDTCWPANDSCVEFFVSPDSNNTYSNFEFSCIGYCLIESGEKGTKRIRQPLETTKQVRRVSTLGSTTFAHREGDFSWTITIAIPLSLITEQKGTALSGTQWTANFYKCGDELKEKAYLAWSPVNMPFPTFHQPQEFGTIVFE